MQSNESIYIAGGAVVYGCIEAQGASNLRISGRGILDVSSFPRGEGGGFTNIRVEVDEWNPPPRMQSSREEVYQASPQDRYLPTLMVIVIFKTNYSQDMQRGTVRGVEFRDISVSGPLPTSSFSGFDAEHGVAGVTVTNLRVNGQPVTNATEARLRVGPHVQGVQFTAVAR